jgi:hypothetical protein
VQKQQRDELLIITKVYDLILWSGNHTSRFPKNHRYVLGERIERRLYDLLETLIDAKYARTERTVQRGEFLPGDHAILISHRERPAVLC